MPLACQRTSRQSRCSRPGKSHQIDFKDDPWSAQEPTDHGRPNSSVKGDPRPDRAFHRRSRSLVSHRSTPPIFASPSTISTKPPSHPPHHRAIPMSGDISMTPASIHRTAINRANSQQSTGPRSEAGKQRSALNALTHGLTARTAVLPSEDQAAYQHHCRQFENEYRPATPTEIQLVHELADTSWRLNRLPLLEADVLSRAQSPAPSPQSPAPAVAALATLGLHGQRRDLRDAASVLEFHKHKGLPYDPAEDGFVFSKTEIEAFAQRTMRLNQAWKVENFTLLGFRTPRNARILKSVDAAC